MSEKTKIHSIPQALADIKAGKIVIVADDEDRENEGDFICAAEHITPEIINFMATEGKGLICVGLTQQRCKELNLNLMVPENTSSHGTPFTVSVDVKGFNTTTGISAYDRYQTVKALVNPGTKCNDLARPGHIFPLMAKNEGVLRRAGHSEAAVDLARLAGLNPAGVLVEIMNPDGSMARMPQLQLIAQKHNLKIITIRDLIAYRLQHETLVEQDVEVDMPTEFGNFKLSAFRQVNSDLVHVALTKGNFNTNEAVMVRMHSSCATGDIFGSYRCDCGPQLHRALQMVEEKGTGAVIYLAQEGRGIGLVNKLRAYKLQEDGMDTVEANHALGFNADERDYGIGAQILVKLGIKKIKLITNNPRKRAGLAGYGLEVIDNIPLEIEPNQHNEKYLFTKKIKMNHDILKSKHQPN